MRFSDLNTESIYTAENLQDAVIPHSRQEQIDTIVTLFDDLVDEPLFPMSRLVNDFFRENTGITSRQQLIDYLENLDDISLKTYYSYIRCYHRKDSYNEIYQEVDPRRYFFPDEVEYARKSRALFRDLFEAGFDCLGAGTGRRVFEFDDFVLKVPYNDRGETESDQEFELSQKYPFIADVKPIRYETKNGLSFTLNAMEKVYLPKTLAERNAIQIRVTREYPEYIWWSWGTDSKGNLKVYDFD